MLEQLQMTQCEPERLTKLNISVIIKLKAARCVIEAKVS